MRFALSIRTEQICRARKNSSRTVADDKKDKAECGSGQRTRQGWLPPSSLEEYKRCRWATEDKNLSAIRRLNSRLGPLLAHIDIIRMIMALVPGAGILCFASPPSAAASYCLSGGPAIPPAGQAAKPIAPIPP